MPLDLAAPPSPCQGICQLDADLCIGCGRLMGEIIEWPSAGLERKHTIHTDAARRLAIIKSTRPFGLDLL